MAVALSDEFPLPVDAVLIAAAAVAAFTHATIVCHDGLCSVVDDPTQFTPRELPRGVRLAQYRYRRAQRSMTVTEYARTGIRWPPVRWPPA